MTAGRRDQLASALADWMPAWLPAERRELLDVVDRMIRQAQADELEALVVTSGIPMSSSVVRLLRDRAAALRVTTDHPDVTQDGP